MNELPKQAMIPVITKMKELEQFLLTDLKITILQDIHISLLKDMIDMLHEYNKIGLVHIEMIKGVSNDEFGTQYLCQHMKVDGIISSKSKIIEMAKKNHVRAIQRVFLIDSKSLERGVEMIEQSQPDIVEIMPAIAFSIFAYIKKLIQIPIWAGGLVKTAEQADQILAAGASAITISNLALCVEYNRKHRN